MLRPPRWLVAGLALAALTALAPAAHAQSVEPVEPAPEPSEPAEPAPEPGPPYDAVVEPFVFPVDGTVSYAPSFDAPRGGGTRIHKATDLGGPGTYGLPVHAAVAGTIGWITGVGGEAPGASAGYALGINGVDGRTYRYMHLGAQDGPADEAYAPGIARGVHVSAGQLIGFLGHSGNASPSWPHLHFEIMDERVANPYGEKWMDPYPSLRAAQGRGDVPAGHRRFLDVAPTSTHHDAIVWLADAGITSGCGTLRFCPVEQVTRGQLATLLAAALQLPPAADPVPFSDVAVTHTHADGIARLRAAGIAKGAADGTFGPDDRVTREQMASLLSIARGDDLVLASAMPFVDVDPGSVHAPAIVALHAAGIARGSAGAFHPAKPVTRAEMASFLQRSFDGADA